MTVLVTPEEMRAVERATIESGRPASELMRVAGEGVAAWIVTAAPQVATRPLRALGLIGPGNNGGDALVALATLAGVGWSCAAIFIGRREIGKLPAGRADLASIEFLTLSEAESWNPDFVLDGIFGIGGRATLMDDARQAIALSRRFREERRSVLVAVDLPSGIDCASGEAAEGAFPADVTLCLGLPKIGLIREPAATHVGELVVLDIGLREPDLRDRPVLLDSAQARQLAPRRRASAHKTNAGAVLVIGGARTYYGAPRLAGGAALRIGAGLVCVAAPEEIVASIATQVPELTFIPLSGGEERQVGQLDRALDNQADRFNSHVIGPGLGRDDRAVALCDWALRPNNRHFQRDGIVLDADALYWLASQSNIRDRLAHVECVLTPHAGELARLRKCSIDEILRDPILVAAESAREWDQVVVLKSGYSIVAAPDGRAWIAPRAMPELATAGTGDVFAGSVGGLIAQGLSSVDAARLAMYLGAMAGRAARSDAGIGGVVARDVIERIPHVARDLSEPAWNAEWLRQPRLQSS